MYKLSDQCVASFTLHTLLLVLFFWLILWFWACLSPLWFSYFFAFKIWFRCSLGFEVDVHMSNLMPSLLMLSGPTILFCGLWVATKPDFVNLVICSRLKLVFLFVITVFTEPFWLIGLYLLPNRIRWLASPNQWLFTVCLIFCLLRTMVVLIS